MAKQPKSKVRQRTYPRRFQLPLADAEELNARDELIRNLERLGDDLDAALRRIGSYLAWIHRDVLRLKTHVTNLRLELEQEKQHGKTKGSPGNHD